MESITKDVLDDFYRYTSHEHPERILEHHRCLANGVHHYREKIKNPVHYRTGKPLKAITIKVYHQTLHFYERSLRDSKTVIKMLVAHGILGSKGMSDKVTALHPYRRKKEDELLEKRVFEVVDRELSGERKDATKLKVINGGNKPKPSQPDVLKLEGSKALAFRYFTFEKKKDRLWLKLDTMMALASSDDWEDGSEWWDKFNVVDKEWKGVMEEMEKIESELIDRGG